MDVRCFQRLMYVFPLILCVLVVVSDVSGTVRFNETSFEGVRSIREVECSASGEVMGMHIWDKKENSTHLVSLSTHRGVNTCTTSSAFAACDFSEISSTVTVTGRVLITDLEEGGSREYQCTVNFWGGPSFETVPEIKSIIVTRPPETTPTSGPRTTKVSTRVSSPSTQAPLLPTSVVVVILVVLIILATTTFNLIGILCRQHQKSRKESPQVAHVETADYLEPVPAPASRNTGRAQETPASSENAALESDDYEDAEAVSGFAAQAVPRGPYETLEMSDMGLRSDYSELGAEEPQAAQGRGDYYSSLQMSNVGLRSDYSEFGGQNDTA